MSDLLMKNRFDGYLPVVIDVETTGVDASKHALLEVAAVSVKYDDKGLIVPAEEHFSSHINPFDGCVIDEKAMEINGIQPSHPFRSVWAVSEGDALTSLFTYISNALKEQKCRRALLVGHNAHFDLGFIRAAMVRCKITKSPLHAFTVMDTATLAGAFFGKTVLAKAIKCAGIEFDSKEAHSALYDTLKTAELFCQIVNNFPVLENNK
jgi:ribonuclease T